MHAGPKPRTRADKAAALCTRLILAKPERIAELIGTHTAETFAAEHGVPVRLVRETFERAKGRLQS